MSSAALKLERLLNLTALLVDTTRPVSAEEIHRQIYGYPEKFESFRRAFERDKDELREMGVRIETRPMLDHGAQTGYVVEAAQFHLADPRLTVDERVALQLALSLVRLDSGGGSPTDPIDKLGGRERERGAESAAEPVADLVVTPLMATVFEAIADRRSVTFGYRGERRVIHPYRLDFQRGRWYLTGHDTARDALRVFRLDRIEHGEVGHALVLGPRHEFVRPEHVAGVRLEPWRFGDDPPVRAVLAVDDDAAPTVREALGSDASWTSAGPDTWRVEVDVTDRAAFRSAVVGLLDAVEVLEPADLRAEIVEWLSALVSDPAGAP